MMDVIGRIEATIGVTIFPTGDGRWQVSTRNEDGSFRVFIKEKLVDALEAALPAADDFDIGDYV